MPPNDFLLNPDPLFAQKLDANCGRCADGLSNNWPQIKALKQRLVESPEETSFIKALKEKCQACFTMGKPEGRRIIDTHSCMYRGGIHKTPRR